MGLFFNVDNGDIGYAFSDDMGIDSSGNLFIRLSEHEAMDATTGDINLVDGWENDS